MTFGSMEFSTEFFESFKNHVPHGSSILEFGSGSSTKKLVDAGYRVFSIEENLEFVDKYGSEYLYAPIVDDWYDVSAVRKFLSDKKYSAVIIDGPAYGDRFKILEHLGEIDISGWVFVDDIDRSNDRKIFDKLKSQRTYEDMGVFGIIYPGG